MSEQIRAGFGRADITPEEFGPMGGFGNDNYRICTNVYDHLFGTVIAITDASDSTVLLISCDMLHTNNQQTAICRQTITAATGIPGDKIMIAATHTHSGPSINGDSEFTENYYHFLAEKLSIAAQDALADSRPATIEIARGIAKNMTFDRHYFNDKGEYVGNGAGQPLESLAAHVAIPDEQMQFIRFLREGARDILLMNWQAHVTFVGGPETDTNMSADYVGVLRDQIEGRTGCRFAFFQGACGNLTPGSKMTYEQPYTRTLNPRKRYIPYGKMLADMALQAIENMTEVKAGPVKTQRLQYQAVVDHTDDYRLENANLYWNKYYEWTPEERKEYAQKFGFRGRLHAGAIKNRAKAGQLQPMELNVVTVGDISFATAPYEMFCSNGMYIKENTPFEMTFVMGYCNGSFSYLADKQEFQYGDACYEVFTRRYVEGTAEDIVENHVRMLNELKEA